MGGVSSAYPARLIDPFALGQIHVILSFDRVELKPER
jgi:hypothetical protein